MGDMIHIEFLQDYKTCWKKGDTRDCLPHFAKTMIDLGIAKAVKRPKRHKMVKGPEMAKEA